jgi:hypothetical protein
MDRHQQVVIANYFIQAYASDVADADKDGLVSVLEAFDYARREVVRAYESENHLLTEHAQLDDNGDHKGTGAPDAKSEEGALARRVFLGGRAGSVAAAARGASNDPRVATLEREKDSIETQIDSPAPQGAMDSTAYEKALEGLLVQLAEKNKAIRDWREVGRDGRVDGALRTASRDGRECFMRQRPTSMGVAGRAG